MSFLDDQGLRKEADKWRDNYNAARETVRGRVLRPLEARSRGEGTVSSGTLEEGTNHLVMARPLSWRVGCHVSGEAER